MKTTTRLVLAASVSLSFACGGGGGSGPNTAHDAKDDHSVKHTKCGEHDKVHEYDIAARR